MVILNPWRLIAKEMVVFLAAVCLFMATLVVSLQLLTPYLNRQLPNLNLWIAQKMPVPTQIDQVYITWIGLRPALRAENVQWLDADKQPVVFIEHVDFIINPLDSLINQRWHVKQIYVDNVIVPERAGDINVWPILTESLTPLKLLQAWMIDHIEVERIQWGDFPTMSMHMSRDDDWMRWQLEGVGRWEGIVDFTPLTQGRSGQLYVSGQSLPLTLFSGVGHLEARDDHEPLQGDIELWANFHKSQWRTVDANIQLENTPLGENQPVSCQLSGRWADDVWQGEVIANAAETTMAQAHWTASARGWQVSMPKMSWSDLNWQASTVSGQWHDVLITGQWAGWWSAQGHVKDMTFTSDQQLHLSGVAGHCQADPRGGFCQVDSPELALDVEGQRWAFQSVKAPIHWQLDEQQRWSVDSEQVVLQWAEQPWQGWMSVTGQQANLIQQTWQVSTPTVGVHALVQALEDSQLSPKLQTWLQQSLSTGTLQQAQVHYHHLYDEAKKPIIAFPNFSIEAELKDTPVQYAPQWPTAQLSDGTLALDHGHLWIDAKSASTGEDIQAVATISALNIHHPDAVLQVSTQPTGTLRAASDWIQQTPLASRVGEALSHINPEGPLKADLTFRLPLDDPEKVDLNGVIWLEEATIQGPEALSWLSAEQVSGQLILSETQLHAENITAQLFDQPAIIHLNGHYHPQDAASAQFRIGVEGHTDVAWWAEHGFLLPDMSGEFDFYSDVQLSWTAQGYPLWQVSTESDWSNVTIDWPAPFKKPAGTTQLVSATMDWAWPDQMGLRVQFGEHLSLAQRFKRDMSEDDDTQWQWLGGHVVIDEAPFATFPEERGWLIEGNLPHLKLSDWYQWYQANTFQPTQDQEDDIQWDLNVDTLQWSDLSWSNVHWQGHASTSHVYVKAVGPDMDVTATWLPQSPHLLSIEATHLKVPHWPKALSDEPMDWAAWHQGPHIQLQCDQCYFQQTLLNGLSIHLINQKTGYQIKQAQALPSGDVAFNLTGQYTLDSPRQGELKGQALFKDIGHTIRVFGLPSALRDAPANIQGHVAWQGDQWQDVLQTASGHAQVHLKQGRILGVEPGLGRILSLLSLSNIKRRLTLDFSDLTRKGFSFDELSGRVDVGHGTLRSPALNLKGPIADVLFSGQVGLIEPHPLNIEMTLSPHITKALPLAVLIASGNPAVGAGAWLLNKALGKNVGNKVTYRYAVTGEWDSPNIKELAIYQDVPQK